MIVNHAEDIEYNVHNHPESTADNEAGIFGDLACKLHQLLHEEENNDSE